MKQIYVCFLNFNCSSHNHTGQSSSESAANSVRNTNKQVATYVFGGLPSTTDPLEFASFGEWAATVDESPMPVRYELSPFDQLKGYHFGTKAEWTSFVDSYHLMLSVRNSHIPISV
jgi:hypothetical protein